MGSRYGAILGGALGGFLAVLLLGAGVVAFLFIRSAGGPDERALLLQEIDAFEQWFNDDSRPGVAGRYFCANVQAGNPRVGPRTTTSTNCRDYDAAVRRFLAQHGRLSAYLAWLSDTRAAEANSFNPILQTVAQNPTFADMRDPKYLDPYLASR